MDIDDARNDLPVFLFHQGVNFRALEYFGCRPDGGAGGRAVFRVWAPRAKEVSVVGDWNGWDEQAHPMRKITPEGVWEAVVGSAQQGHNYKYSILGADRERRLKSDPFAVYSETEGKTASVVYDINGYVWRDGEWMRRRGRRAAYDKPVNIYEIHAGSWKKRGDGRPLTYLELADELVPYLTDMGYTHLELMPVMEHLFGHSWGYQICGYFSATSRHGEPKELMALIDRCHNAGIGVILDWVPACFPADAHGLADFDGKPLYETSGQKNRQQDWGTRRFDLERAEVQSFLISSALFWLEHFHADGLRVDAISTMIYPENGNGNGERAAYEGNEDMSAIAFLRKLNKAVSDRVPGAMMIAEGAAALPRATKPIHDGGLGFDFRWNTGWTNDMLDYIAVDPVHRGNVHDKLTSSFFYAFSENFILPVPHGEVVYGKRALLDKMPGDYEWKFAGTRAFLGYMMTHPGKKLNFMGTEIGQFREWDHESAVEWFLTDEFPAHRQLRDYVRALNRFYLDTPALWEIDFDWEGFQWICADDREQNIVIFLRADKNGGNVVALHNFAPVTREGYRFGVPEAEIYEEVFNSDRAEFGGFGHENGAQRADHIPMHGLPYSLCVTVPPLATVCFKCADKKPAYRRANGKRR